MVVPVTGKILLDTNVFVDYLRADLHAEWVFGHVGQTVRFLSSVVLMELRLGADTPKRTRAVDRIRSAFPDQRVIAPSPRCFDRAGTLFRAIHGAGDGLRDRLGAINDLLIALSAVEIGAAVLTGNRLDFGRIAKHLPGLRVVYPVAD